MLSTTDAADYHALQSDPEVKRFLGGPTTCDVDYYRRRLAGIKPQLDSPLAITGRRTGEFLGCCGFTHDAFLDGWEINIVLMRQKWRYGLASEVLVALLQTGFNTLGVSTLFGVAHPQNEASIALLRKFHFERQEHIRYARWEVETQVYAIQPQT
jgi:RimJ/RimL family protein N-acetyltransferase